MMIDRVVLIHSDYGWSVDGIRDHGERLTNELSKRLPRAEHRVHAVKREDSGSQSLWRTLHSLRHSGPQCMIFIQYMPFCFARWGFAPWLPILLLMIRLSSNRPTIALMVHEPYVPMTSWRWALMGMWQRLQLRAMVLFADVVFTSVGPWTRQIGGQRPARPVHHLPVGSNFPDRRSARQASRRELDVDDDALVVAAIGRDHPSWLGDYVVEAANEIVAAGHIVVLLLLGAEAPVLSGLHPAIGITRPGHLNATELASRVAAADVFLAPLSDGVSTRRGTVMVALQHGKPIVGTRGPLTDAVLGRSDDALALVAADDRRSFAATAAQLAADPARRAALGEAARVLYAQNFDWDIVATKMLGCVPAR